MSDIELEWEQRKIEKLYGDRIENTDQSKLLSGDELAKAALESLERFKKTGTFK